MESLGSTRIIRHPKRQSRHLGVAILSPPAQQALFVCRPTIPWGRVLLRPHTHLVLSQWCEVTFRDWLLVA